MKDKADKKTLDAFKSGRGGYRPGAGRLPLPPGERRESHVVRVPVELLPAVRALIAGQSNADGQQAVRPILERWRAASAGKENQPRWQNVCRLLSELQDVF